ncbi:MAG: hypothetical protein J4F39_11500, partial [Candidatus Latescibacteria bacterium]|nr:hypothetical protein [Candidatus Latescibacterota bacterium]
MRPTLLLLSLLLGACAAAPEVNPPDLDVTIPEGWAAGRAGTAPADTLWWGSFNDETLRDLVSEALARNHNLQASAASVR